MAIHNPCSLVLPDSLFGEGLVLPYLEHVPVLGEGIFLAPQASLIGAVTVGDRVSVWFGAVLRGDISAVEVGEGSNIQDQCVLHVGDDAPCIVRRRVVVGHGAILHGCTVEDECLIGMGATVLNHAVIGEGSIVGAGALVTQGMVIPPNSLVLGNPAKVVRPVRPEEREKTLGYAQKYIKVAQNYRPLFQLQK